MNFQSLTRATTLVFSILLQSSANAQTECFTPPELEALHQIEKAAEQNDLWPGFDLKKVQLAIRTETKEAVYFFGVDDSVLSKARLQFSRCIDSSSVRRIELAEELPAIPNGVYTFVFPGNQSYGAVSSVVQVTTRPIIVLSFDTLLHLPAFDPSTIARTFAHESFHMDYQFFGGFNLDGPNNHPRDFYKTCILDQEWNDAHEGELKLVNKIREKWPVISTEELESDLKEIAKFRTKVGMGRSASTCFSHAGFWERFEGTAHFIDLRTALYLGTYRTVPPTEWADGTEEEYFYKTGVTYSLILERLFPNSNWKERVSAGESPFDILTSLIPRSLDIL